jgi:hypothetical protein
MRDGVLTGDYGSVLQAGGDVMAKIAVYCRDDIDIGRNACDCSKQVDS